MTTCSKTEIAAVFRTSKRIQHTIWWNNVSRWTTVYSISTTQSGSERVSQRLCWHEENVFSLTNVSVTRFESSHLYNGKELQYMHTQCLFPAASLELLAESLYFSLPFPCGLLWFIPRLTPSTGLDTLLLEIAWGISDKYAIYVIRDSGYNTLFQPRRDSTSACLWKRVTVLLKLVEALIRPHWIWTPQYSNLPLCSNRITVNPAW